MFQDCIDEAENVTNLLKDLLTKDDTTVVQGVPTLRKIVTDNKDKTGTAWDSSKNYLKNEIVTKNGPIYIALEDNTNKDPETETDFWVKKEYSVVPGTVGFNKICGVTVSDGNIFAGADFIDNFEKISTGNYKIWFKESFQTADYMALVSGFEGDSFYMGQVVSYDKDYVEIEVYNCSTNSLADPVALYVTFII